MKTFTGLKAKLVALHCDKLSAMAFEWAVKFADSKSNAGAELAAIMAAKLANRVIELKGVA